MYSSWRLEHLARTTIYLYFMTFMTGTCLLKLRISTEKQIFFMSYDTMDQKITLLSG